jgi:hypothetical protein
MYYTNCHRTNHNVETCKVKRKEDHVPIVFEVTTQQIKVQKLVKNSYQTLDIRSWIVLSTMICRICLRTKSETNRKTSYGRTQGFKSLSPYVRHEYGHH